MLISSISQQLLGKPIIFISFMNISAHVFSITLFNTIEFLWKTQKVREILPATPPPGTFGLCCVESGKGSAGSMRVTVRFSVA